MCKGLTGLLFGHKFQPLTIKAIEERTEKDTKVTRTYLIVCPRCGESIDDYDEVQP